MRDSTLYKNVLYSLYTYLAQKSEIFIIDRQKAALIESSAIFISLTKFPTFS
ncbi:hypothetical protein LPICM02_270002 [Pseudolactococcus piscium]|nr:hypothetical protein LPICM02_270002 [Lactococcus piscium]